MDEGEVRVVGAVPPASPPPSVIPEGGARARWGRGKSAVLLVAIAIVAAGAGMRLAAPFVMDLRTDGETYTATGYGVIHYGEFVLPFGDVTTWDCFGPQYSHHFPPMYPLYLASVYEVAGFGLWQTKAAALAISLVALGVVFLCSQDLLGRQKAWLATALVAVDPHLIWATGTGFSENLVLVFFTVTMWAILRSLKNSWFMPIAGLTAGMAYLTRAGMGAFFLFAGVAGLGWRFYYMRWQVFKDKGYLVAIAVFGAFLALWSLRNVTRFGWPNWETSSYVTLSENEAFSHLDQLGTGLALKAWFFLGFLAVYLVPFWPEAKRSLRRILEENESALWLSVALVVVIGWALASIFWVREHTDWWWLDNRRYFVLAIVPIAWIALRHADLTPRRSLTAFPARFTALCLVLLACSSFLFIEPIKSAENGAAEQLSPYLQHGTQIGITGAQIKYSFFPYLARQDVLVYGCSPDGSSACPGREPDFIIALQGPSSQPGYTFLSRSQVHYWNGYVTADVWKRNDESIGPREPTCSGLPEPLKIGP